MSDPLSPFPVDDSTLALIDLALDTALTDQSSLYNLLDLISPAGPHDVIRALIDEVRRLRDSA